MGGAMNGGLACSKMTSGTGTTASNTATFETVQPVVSQVGSGTAANANPSPATTAAALACPTYSGALQAGNCAGKAGGEPYNVNLRGGATVGKIYNAGTACAGGAVAGVHPDDCDAGGLLPAAILKATRGIPQSGTAPAITTTPTACIGPDVIFNNVLNSGIASGVPVAAAAALTAQQGVALCDPNGCVPGQDCVGAPAGGGVADKAVGTTTANGAIPIPSATRTFAQNQDFYSGVQGAAGVIQAGVKLNVQKFWDPITAAQASGGAFCCAALYYGSDGLGRGGATGIAGVTKNKDFKPNALVGDAMETQNVAGGMCSDGSSSTSVKQGLSAALNVKEKEFLEGQAFFASVAPSMYVLPKVNSLQATQTAYAAKQKKCAQTLTTMLKMNQIAKGTSTDATVCKADGRVTAGTTNAACYGTGYSAVPYPLWKVKIGDSSPAEYVVPNGYCYANACIEDFAAVGTATAFKGTTKLSTLQASPDMASNPSTTTNACGRANAACAAPPSTWNGGRAIFTKCSKTTDVLGAPTRDCTDAELKGQIGMLPSA